MNKALNLFCNIFLLFKNRKLSVHFENSHEENLLSLAHKEAALTNPVHVSVAVFKSPFCPGSF